MKKNQIILVIIGILILIGFVYWFQFIRPLSLVSKETSDLCAEFSKVEGEITCQEAIDKVLEEYPGEVKYIKKTKDLLPVGFLPDVEMVEKEVWLIGINLKPPRKLDEIEFNSMEIFVTRDSGELEIKTLTSGEL